MYVTNHSKKRIKERVGIPKKSAERQAKLALERGFSHNETKGRLNKYLSKIYLSHNTGNNLKVYNNHVFLFHNDVLVTVLNLPSELQGKKYLKIKMRKEII